MRWTILIAIFLSVSALSSFAQVQKRTIHFEREDVSGESGLVQVVRIEVKNKQVSINEEFATTDDWLKSLKITVRNVSGKRIIYVGFGFGLLEAIDGELEPYASYQYGVSFYAGEPVKNIKKGKRRFILNPNSETVLTYEKVGARTSNLVLEKAGIGKFHKAKFMVARVQFEDGTFQDTQAVQ